MGVEIWQCTILRIQVESYDDSVCSRLACPVTRAAEGLGVTRQALSDLVNERTSISTEMAIRLSKAFGSTPETWLGMQMAYDLWQARERADQIEIEMFKMPVMGR